VDGYQHDRRSATADIEFAIAGDISWKNRRDVWIATGTSLAGPMDVDLCFRGRKCA